MRYIEDLTIKDIIKLAEESKANTKKQLERLQDDYIYINNSLHVEEIEGYTVATMTRRRRSRAKGLEGSILLDVVILKNGLNITKMLKGFLGIYNHQKITVLKKEWDKVSLSDIIEYIKK